MSRGRPTMKCVADPMDSFPFVSAVVLLILFSLSSSKERNFTHAHVCQVQPQTLPHRELLHRLRPPDAEGATPAQEVSREQLGDVNAYWTDPEERRSRCWLFSPQLLL